MKTLKKFATATAVTISYFILRDIIPNTFVNGWLCGWFAYMIYRFILDIIDLKD